MLSGVIHLAITAVPVTTRNRMGWDGIASPWDRFSSSYCSRFETVRPSQDVHVGGPPARARPDAVDKLFLDGVLLQEVHNLLLDLPLCIFCPIT